MTTIRVTHSRGDVYAVEVDEGGSASAHEVTCTEAQRQRYGGNATAERLIEESFRFLLEREPKESILRRFELPVIERYFPEYPGEIARRL